MEACWGAGGLSAGYGYASGTGAGVGQRGGCTQLTSDASRSHWGHSVPQFFLGGPDLMASPGEAHSEAALGM